MSYTPFQKYLYEAISGPESGIRMYHKPEHGIPPKPQLQYKPPPIDPDDGDEPDDILIYGSIAYYEVIINFIEQMLEHLGGLWDLLPDSFIERFFPEGTTLENLTDELYNDDGSPNTELIDVVFINIMNVLIVNWGDASLGGKLPDFIGRSVLMNGVAGIGGLFNDIRDAMERVLESLENTPMEDATTNKFLIELIELLLYMIEHDGEMPPPCWPECDPDVP